MFSGTPGISNGMFAFPFRIARSMTIERAFWMNGATGVGANIKMGIYALNPSSGSDGQEVKVADTGSVAQSGTNVIQSAVIGPIRLIPGLYYMAYLQDLSTTTLWRNSTYPIEENRSLGQWRITQGSFNLPATMGTPRVATNAVLLIGLAAKTVI